MQGIPYEVPREWHEELDKLRTLAATYPEDEEDRVFREAADSPKFSEEAKQKLRDFIFGGEFKSAADALFEDDPDMQP